MESLEREYAWLDRMMEWLDAEMARGTGKHGALSRMRRWIESCDVCRACVAGV